MGTTRSPHAPTRVTTLTLISIALLLTALYPTHAFAEAGCSYPHEKGLARIEIDMIMGATEGRTTFSRSEEVQVILKNKNPFLYTYRFSADASVVSEPALAGLFQFVLIDTGFARMVKKPAPDSTILVQVMPDSVMCSDAEAIALERLAARHRGLEALIRQTTLSVDALSAAVQQIPKNQQVLGSDAPCHELTIAAQSIAAIDFRKLQQIIEVCVEKLRKEAEEDSMAIMNFENTNEACAKKQENLLKKLLAQTSRSQRIAETAQEVLEEFRKKSGGSLDSLQSSVLSVLQDPTAFVEWHTVGHFQDLTEVKVKVERRKRSDTGSFEVVRELTLHFGGRSRFALSAGPMVSTLEVREYTRVQSLSDPDTAGQTTLTGRIGLKESSAVRLLPLIALHGRLFYIQDLGVHATLGSGLRTDNRGADLEYLMGVSVSACEERFFLTLGEHVGRVQELEGGWHLKDEIPASVADIPIHKRWVMKPALSVEVKFQ